MTSDDIEAQEDEMLALGSIMDPEEFSVHPGEIKSGQIQINLPLPMKFYFEIDESIPLKDSVILEIDPVSNKKRLPVHHSPPLTLHFTLPPDYPSETKPSFTLSSCWLDRSALSTLCKKLDESWDTNVGMAILYTWYSFLKEDTLGTLGIDNSYDLSWWYTSGPNAKSAETGLSTIEESSKKHHQKARVRTRSGAAKDNGNNNAHLGSQKSLDMTNMPGKDIPSSSLSSKPVCSESDSVPNDLTSRRANIQRLKRSKRGASGETVQSWLNESEGGASYVPKSLTSCGSSDFANTHEHHQAKHGRVLDARAVFDWQSFSSILDYLAYFNIEKTDQEFKSTSQTCDICYIEKFGTDCIRFKCSHIFCRECVKHFFSSHITNGSIDSVRCPGYDCKFAPTPDQVRGIVGEELYERYDRLLLTRSLDSMSDVTFCPRAKCRYPAVRDTNEKIANCSACNYVFCPVCLMVYHGVEPCRFKSALQWAIHKLLHPYRSTPTRLRECSGMANCISSFVNGPLQDHNDKKEVYETYTTGTSEDKKRLEKIYGKKQLSLLVETVMSEKWVSNKSKPCPHCSAPIEKFEGCNKVTCFNCNTYFCWICSVQLNRENPYFHFNDPTSKCFNSLFEGVQDDDDDEDEEFEDDYFSDDSEFY